MKHLKFGTVSKFLHKTNKLSALLVSFIVVGAGYAVFSSSALTPYANIEAESGTRTVATTVVDSAASGGLALEFGADQQEPDPNPPLPARPDESTTGPQPGITLSPSSTVTASVDGAVVENLDISGSIIVKANNVTIRNVRVTSSTTSYAIDVRKPFYGTKIEYAEVVVTAANGAIGNQGDSGCTQGTAAGTNVTVRYSHIHGTADGIKAANCSLYENNYIKMRRAEGSTKHIDGIQSSGNSYWTARYNWIDQAYSAGHNGAIFAQPFTGTYDKHIYDILIEKNWVNGGVYTIQTGTPKNGETGYMHNVVINDNIFYRDYLYGVFLPRDGALGNGGVWADTGQRVPVGQIR